METRPSLAPPNTGEKIRACLSHTLTFRRRDRFPMARAKPPNHSESILFWARVQIEVLPGSGGERRDLL